MWIDRLGLALACAAMAVVVAGCDVAVAGDANDDSVPAPAGGDASGGETAGGDDRSACAPQYIVENLDPIPPTSTWDPVCFPTNLPKRIVAQPKESERPLDLYWEDGRLVSLAGSPCTLCMVGNDIGGYDRAKTYNCDTYYVCGGCAAHLAVFTFEPVSWVLFLDRCESGSLTPGSWTVGPANAAGWCVSTCGQYSCGADGCGGRCGPCEAGQQCAAGGFCVDENGCYAGSEPPCCNSCFTDCGGSDASVPPESFRYCLDECVRCCEDCHY